LKIDIGVKREGRNRGEKERESEVER